MKFLGGSSLLVAYALPHCHFLDRICFVLVCTYRLSVGCCGLHWSRPKFSVEMLKTTVHSGTLLICLWTLLYYRVANTFFYNNTWKMLYESYVVSYRRYTVSTKPTRVSFCPFWNSLSLGSVHHWLLLPYHIVIFWSYFVFVWVHQKRSNNWGELLQAWCLSCLEPAVFKHWRIVWELIYMHWPV